MRRTGARDDAVPFHWDGEIFLPRERDGGSSPKSRVHGHSRERIDHSRGLAGRAIQLPADGPAEQRQVWLRGEETHE